MTMLILITKIPINYMLTASEFSIIPVIVCVVGIDSVTT